MGDKSAKDAVIQAIKHLVGQGKRAYSQNVPGEATAILLAQEGAMTTRADAGDRVKQAIVTLQSEGEIECHLEPHKDWMILEDSRQNSDEPDQDDKAVVLEVMDGLVRARQRAYVHNVPEEATKLLLRRGAGRITRSDANERVKRAIESLARGGKIDCHLEPYKDWKILH